MAVVRSSSSGNAIRLYFRFCVYRHHGRPQAWAKWGHLPLEMFSNILIANLPSLLQWSAVI